MLHLLHGSLAVRLAFWLCLAGVVILSLVPTDRLPDEVGLVWDKAQHAGGFVLLTILGLSAYPGRLWAVGLGLLAAGAGIELAQEATGWRQGDVLDLLADAAGIVIGLAWALLPASPSRSRRVE